MCGGIAGLVIGREVVFAVMDQGVVVVFGRLRRVARPLVWALWVALPSVLTTVPPVLDCIVAASLQTSRNLSPPLAHLSDHLFDQLALVRRNGIMVQRRLKVLVVTFPALLR
jgi:hypothetical protein